MSNSEIFKRAKNYLKSLFDKNASLNSLFHSYLHAVEVANVARNIAHDHPLNEKELNILLLAALFQDSGILRKSSAFDQESMGIAKSFFEDQPGHIEYKEPVLALIGSQKKENDQKRELTDILEDARNSWIGRKRFFRESELLRIEDETLRNQTYSDYKWEKKQYELLINTQFYTKAAYKRFESRRLKNISKQRTRIEKARRKSTRKQTGKDIGRGIDTLYRANYRNHINLSSIADGKANMMISINTIILSIIVTLSGAGFTLSDTFIIQNLKFSVPVMILLIGSLISVVFAILSARPKVTASKIDMENLDTNKTSLLYFGNFRHISLKQFIDYLKELKKDQIRLYDSMSVDLYYLGKVLDVKYRLLNWAYIIFMCGLVLSVTSFIIIFLTI